MRSSKNSANYADKPPSHTWIFDVYVRLATQNQLTHPPQALLLLPATVSTPNPTTSGVLGRPLTINEVWGEAYMRCASSQEWVRKLGGLGSVNTILENGGL